MCCRQTPRRGVGCGHAADVSGEASAAGQCAKIDQPLLELVEDPTGTDVCVARSSGARTAERFGNRRGRYDRNDGRAWHYSEGSIESVTVTGEYDLSNVAKLDDALRSVLSSNTTSCLLDLSGVTFMDSTVVRP